MNEQKLIKFYESVKTALEEEGFIVEATYRTFNIMKNGEMVGTCHTTDGLNSWLEAYRFSANK